MRRGALLAVAAAALLLTGCLKKAEDQVPTEGIDAISNAVEDQLNAPVVSILAVLRAANDQHRVNWTDLTIGFDGQQIPVNWWLYRKGLVELSGSNVVGGGTFLLARKTTDLLASSDSDWFEVEPGDPTRVDCTGPTARASGGCEVDMPFVAKLTLTGQSVGAATPARFAVQAVVVLNDNGEWQVNNLVLSGTQSIHNLALDAILGPEEGRAAAQAAVTRELQGRSGIMEPAPLSSQAPPLPPIEAPPIIAPTAPRVPDYAAGRRVAR
jgi:hypothetical protein